MSDLAITRLACPDCRRSDQLEIHVTGWADIATDGTINSTTVIHEWTRHSHCYCGACGFENWLSMFERAAEVPS